MIFKICMCISMWTSLSLANNTMHTGNDLWPTRHHHCLSFDFAANAKGSCTQSTCQRECDFKRDMLYLPQMALAFCMWSATAANNLALLTLQPALSSGDHAIPAKHAFFHSNSELTVVTRSPFTTTDPDGNTRHTCCSACRGTRGRGGGAH